MRIVIADDEYLVQASLISMIEEMDDDYFIAGVASDGRQLVEVIRDKQPDFAIVDIKMPYLSGIEAINDLKRDFPHLEWIILSGYSEFTLAQEAIKLGASGYLLKPAGVSELRAALDKVRTTLLARTEFMNNKFEAAMISLGYGLGSGLSPEESRRFNELQFLIATFSVDSGLADKEQLRLLSGFCCKAKERLRTIEDPHFCHSLLFLDNGEPAIICGFKKDRASKRTRELVQAELSECMRASIQPAFGLTMIGAECDSSDRIKSTLDDLRAASRFRILCGINRSWRGQELNRNKCEREIQWCEKMMKLAKSYSEGSHALYLAQLAEIKPLFEAGLAMDMKKAKQNTSDYLLHAIQCRLDADEPLERWIPKLKEHGQLLLAQVAKPDRPQDCVLKALLYMEANYMRDISVLQVASEFQVSANYLSTVFHRKTGSTFMKHLTQIRMRKAKELLEHSDCRVHDVAERVGYANPRYFSKLFLEFTGKSPIAYKRTSNVE
ncbi:response regulator [Cohnella sp. AR92]|uniref:response regulator n=1 Tax=Cohnella sp. AR92 TaxID=648716 RepID=UPI00131564A3|nr:response regulator [Cohnella sp. AR92]